MNRKSGDMSALSRRIRISGNRAMAMAGALLLLGVGSGCKSGDSQAKMTRELLALSKEEAYAKGEALIAKKKLDAGRQYIRFVAENYANDPIGKQAALKLADSYFDEKNALGYLEAQARFRDFRSRYPSHPRTDYALFRLAQCADRQAEHPERDQTNTRIAANSYRELLQLYPGSPWAEEARARFQAMRNLLAEHEFRVANHYYRRGFLLAAKSRYEFLLKFFPEYSGMDQVLFEAGKVYEDLSRSEDSLACWQRLKNEFPTSRFVKKLSPDLPMPASVPPASTAPGF
jgi:outer membrane protein assembly factor BamD